MIRPREDMRAVEEAEAAQNLLSPERAKDETATPENDRECENNDSENELRDDGAP